MRTRHLFLILFSLLVSSPPIVASDWVAIHSSNFVTIYVDKQSIKGDASSREFWETLVFGKEQLDEHSGKHFIKGLQYMEVDCNNHIYKTHEIILYASDDEVVSTKAFSKPYISRIAPDTAGEGVEKYVCNFQQVTPKIESGWVFIASSVDSNTSMYVDRQSIKGDANSREVWEKMVFKEKLGKEPVSGKYPNEIRLHVEIDCDNNTFIGHEVRYLDDGQEINRFSPPRIVTKIDPNSLTESVKEYVCSDWVHVGTYEDFRLYVDKQSIKRNATIVRVWVKGVYNKTQKIPDTDKYYVMRREYWEIDCKNDLGTVHQMGFYSDDNKLVIGWHSSEVNVKIIPNSVGDFIEKYVCKF